MVISKRKENAVLGPLAESPGKYMNNIAPMGRRFLLLCAAGIAYLALSTSPVFGGTIFSGTVTLTDNQVSDYFVYNVTDGTNTFTGIKSLGTIPGGVTLPFNFSISQVVTSGYATILGLYLPPASIVPGGVSVVVPTAEHDSLIANSTTWDTLFPGTPEASIMAVLGTNDAAVGNSDGTTLLNFLNTYNANFVTFNGNTLGKAAGVVLFSTAANGGSISLNVNAAPNVPEPSTFLMLALGAGAILIARRRGFKKSTS